MDIVEVVISLLNLVNPTDEQIEQIVNATNGYKSKQFFTEHDSDIREAVYKLQPADEEWHDDAFSRKMGEQFENSRRVASKE